MAHLSLDARALEVTKHRPASLDSLRKKLRGLDQVCLVWLSTDAAHDVDQNLIDAMTDCAKGFGPNAVLITICDPAAAVRVHTAVSDALRYQLWIAVKRIDAIRDSTRQTIDQNHFAALVHTSYRGSLRHTKTRLAYTFCPACDKTTKDYGGKKHTYHEYGTLLSDIWRDIACNPDDEIKPVIARFADLFGLSPYEKLEVFDCRHFKGRRRHRARPSIADSNVSIVESRKSELLTGDCIEHLSRIPDNSIDFAFADPPYNIGKGYVGYADDRKITDYFVWCDRWLSELARVLKPGCTLALINIPLWTIRHFVHLETILRFQNWIAWDGLSLPVRMIMPSHYAIVCFSKGTARLLPGMSRDSAVGDPSTSYLSPLAENFCLRASCVQWRKRQRINDRAPLADLWWDVHRLKHNSRRVDHPCQLPPALMYRLIGLFTNPGEIVLDPFNGAGTTTLCAQQMNRRWLGIELSEVYSEIASTRHKAHETGDDPFAKADRILAAKNSRVQRVKKQVYEIPKRTLQLEVRRVAQVLGRIPSREELIRLGQYPIRFYDNYFLGWGEVCAAARTTGMTENRAKQVFSADTRQMELFGR